MERILRDCQRPYSHHHGAVAVRASWRCGVGPQECVGANSTDDPPGTCATRTQVTKCSTHARPGMHMQQWSALQSNQSKSLSHTIAMLQSLTCGCLPAWLDRVLSTACS